MTPERTRFHDPALKQAVRRAWGAETAPPELRQKIEAELAARRAAEEDDEPEPAGDVIRVAPSFWRRYPRVGLAAAAAVVLGISLAAVQVLKPRGADTAGVAALSAPAPEAGSNLPAALAQHLVRSHDVCVRFHPDDHHLFDGAPKDNFKEIAARMTAQLRYPVVATAMGHDWEFRGAGLCPVGGKRVAHLMYWRDGAYVSVFSLPASAYPGTPDHHTYDGSVNDHPLAGFAASGAIYCVVASPGKGGPPVDLQQVRAIRDQLRGDVAALTARAAAVRFADAAQ